MIHKIQLTANNTNKQINDGETNARSRKNIGQQLLVTLDRLPRPCSHGRAKEAEAAARRQNLPRNYAHFLIPIFTKSTRPHDKKKIFY